MKWFFLVGGLLVAAVAVWCGQLAITSENQGGQILFALLAVLNIWNAGGILGGTLAHWRYM